MKFSGSKLTVSIGVAHFPNDGNDAEQLLAEADRRMYKEKRAEHDTPKPQPVWTGEWTSTVH